VIDPSARRPLYRQLADDLHQRIASGEFPPGSSLPSEPDLGTAYGLGLQTVRNAIDLLVLRGLVVKRHGARTRVRETVPMSVAYFPPGHRVWARIASDEERREWDLPPGTIALVVIEIVSGMEVDSYPADRYELEPGHSDR
jgi:DNA-binding transcriptional MocR family regulator